MKKSIFLLLMLAFSILFSGLYSQSKFGMNLYYSMGRTVPGTSLEQTIGNDPENPAEVNMTLANPNLEASAGVMFRYPLGRRFELQFGGLYTVNQYFRNLFSTPFFPDPVIGGPPPGAPADPNCPLTTLNRRHHIEIPVQLRMNLLEINKVTLYSLAGGSMAYKFSETARFVQSGEKLDLLNPADNQFIVGLRAGMGLEYALSSRFSIGGEALMVHRLGEGAANKWLPGLNVQAGWKFGKEISL